MKVPSPRRFTFPLFVNEVWCGFVDIYVLDACVIEKKVVLGKRYFNAYKYVEILAKCANEQCPTVRN